MKHCHMANVAIPDEKYQNSPTGGQAFPDGGASPRVPPPCSAAPDAHAYSSARSHKESITTTSKVIFSLID